MEAHRRKANAKAQSRARAHVKGKHQVFLSKGVEFEEFKQELQEKKVAKGTLKADIHIVGLLDYKKSQPFVVGDNSAVGQESS